MDGEVISISSSSNSSSGCSSADLIDTDDHTNKDQQGQVKNSTSSEQNNSGSITTEPVRDSDAACNDWEIYETWTILGEPVIKPIITEPLKQQQQQQPNVSQLKNLSVEKLSDISVSANFADVIEDECVVLSEPCIAKNSTNNSLTKSTDVECSDCDTPSDGISVISDCSDCALHRDSPLLPNETQTQLGHVNPDCAPFDTPPTTPRGESPTFKSLPPPDLSTRESSDKFSLESKPSRPFEVVSPANIILFSLLAGITGIVLGNAFRVRPEEDSSILNHISPLVLRIQDLERENSNLKTQLKKFKPLDAGAPSGATGPDMVFPRPLEFYVEQDINENGKRVWTGDPNNEDPITLVNSKLKIPEFCAEDTADDLFSERYQQICDEKARNLPKIAQGSQMQSDTASSTCSGCQSCSASSGTKQSDVEANFADDDESSVDRIKLERDKSPQVKRKLKRQKPVKDDSSDSSDTVTNDHDKPAAGTRKGCAGIFEKRKKDKTNSKEDKETKKTKRPSDDWYEKRKSGRDELRRSNNAASSGTDDWFSKRASNREKQRGSGSDRKK